MKTVIKLIIACILCWADSTARTNNKTKDPYHLIIEGEFLAQKHIQYTVYKMDNSGKFVSESHNKGRKYYYISCDRGGKYIVRFQDKTGSVKFLMIDATREGYFAVNVDFRKSYDACIKFSKTGYVLIPLTNAGIKDPIAQK